MKFLPLDLGTIHFVGIGGIYIVKGLSRNTGYPLSTNVVIENFTHVFSSG